MKKLKLVFICPLLFIIANAFAESGISYSGGDGTSVKTAIVINGAKGEMDGVHSENEWIREKLPGAKKVAQALVNKQNRLYDRIEVRFPDETTRNIYFDITEFFGKM